MRQILQHVLIMLFLGVFWLGCDVLEEASKDETANASEALSDEATDGSVEQTTNTNSPTDPSIAGGDGEGAHADASYAAEDSGSASTAPMAPSTSTKSGEPGMPPTEASSTTAGGDDESPSPTPPEAPLDEDGEPTEVTDEAPEDPAEPEDPETQSGVLTAAIWNDLENYDDFLTFIDRYPEYQSDWALDYDPRVTFLVKGANDQPVPSTRFVLSAGDNTLYDGRTSPQGKVVWFVQGDPAEVPETLRLAVTYGESEVTADLSSRKADESLKTFHEFKLTTSYVRAAKPALDLAFVIDTTGSMGDELEYLQAELRDIVHTVKLDTSSDDVRMAVVFYKDRGDQYVTKVYDFTSDLDIFHDRLGSTFASGGGDFPEALNEALAKTFSDLSWKTDARSRLCFLVADAPPNMYDDEEYTYVEGIADAQEAGVKIYPIAASGINKSTEFLFRHIAVATQGQYIFLTDDSGVGGSHITPDITGYQVERLDNLLIRVIEEDMKPLYQAD